MYNVYNSYMYNIMIGIEQLNTFSCANKKRNIRTSLILVRKGDTSLTATQ